MTKKIKRRTKIVRFALLLILSIFLLVPTQSIRAGTQQSASFRIQSHWTYMQSFVQRSGDLELRVLNPELAALRWTWPPIPLFPRAQCLLFDGQEILVWSEPEGLESPLDPNSRQFSSLRPLGVEFLVSFLTGQGLEAFIENQESDVISGWNLKTGLLGGFRAELKSSGSTARRLIWHLPQGRLDCRWTQELGGRRIRLDIRPESGGKIRLRSRSPEITEMTPQALFFQ